MLDQPTRGLDVGSIEFIHRQMIAKRDAGTAVLLVSAELDEVLELSDRIGVMYRGDRGACGRPDRRPERGRAADGDRRSSAGRATRGGQRRMTDRGRDPPRQDGRTLARDIGRCAPLPLVAIVLALVAGAVVILAVQLVIPGQASIPPCRSTAYAALLEGALGSGRPSSTRSSPPPR